eukprot:TRINITY_DN7706_c0_g2_i1.p1 TRINITY_DN7706_c0_g2~~TRINITY_DN7706_c0_g2_i1.p1  ORF type:complete len:197 (+),score=22.89 TRINITY_DN7706_c0_g2_i1:34-624(+)
MKVSHCEQKVSQKKFQDSLYIILDEVKRNKAKIRSELISSDVKESHELAGLLENLDNMQIDRLQLEQKKQVSGSNGVICMVLAKEDEVWCGCVNGKILIWNIKTDQTWELEAHSSQIYTIVASGVDVWTASEDKAIHIFDIQNRARTKRLLNHQGIIKSLILVGDDSGTGYTVWSGDSNGSILIWKVLLLMFQTDE